MRGPNFPRNMTQECLILLSLCRKRPKKIPGTRGASYWGFSPCSVVQSAFLKSFFGTRCTTWLICPTWKQHRGPLGEREPPNRGVSTRKAIFPHRALFAPEDIEWLLFFSYKQNLWIEVFIEYVIHIFHWSPWWWHLGVMDRTNSFQIRKLNPDEHLQI